MSDYVKDLERQNEELRERLALAEIWLPMWKRADNDHWTYVRGPCTYGKIDFRRGQFHVSCVAREGAYGTFNNIEDAKAHLELHVIEFMRANPG